jgi:hypothetical protein
MRKPVIPYSFETPFTMINFVLSISFRELVSRYSNYPIKDEFVIDVIHDEVNALTLTEFYDLTDELFGKTTPKDCLDCLQ